MNTDVVTSHPAFVSYVKDACVNPGVANALAETRAWNDHCSGINGGCSFVPCAVETYGRLRDVAQRLLLQFTAVAACSGESTPDDPGLVKA